MEMHFQVDFSSRVTFSGSLADLKGLFGEDSLFVIDSSTVHLLPDLPAERIFLFGGEKEKDFETVGRCLTWLLSCGATRKTKLVAIGGGATTDFAAFTASIFHRGMRLVLVPTTLLSMVDSAVGGKTAVNLAAKNTVGSFYPAEEIVIVREFLSTLGPVEKASGKAEIVKLALIRGGELARKVFGGDDLTTDESIRLAIGEKLEIVSGDLTDTLGKRIVLNWGHTFGHAIERAYSLPHGLAVAAGMVLEQRWAEIAGACDLFPPEKVEYLLALHGIGVDTRAYIEDNLWKKLIFMDKKRNFERISMVYLIDLGKTGIICRDLNDILKDLEDLR